SGNARFPAQLENSENRVVNRVDFLESPLGTPAEHLLATAVDHAAGVGGVVGRIEDAALLQKVAVPRLQELVVGPAHHQLRGKLGNRLVVEDSAEGARGEDVCLGRIYALRRHCSRAEFFDYAIDTRAVHIAGDEPGSGAVEFFAEIVAHVAAALDS